MTAAAIYRERIQVRVGGCWTTRKVCKIPHICDCDGRHPTNTAMQQVIGRQTQIRISIQRHTVPAAIARCNSSSKTMVTMEQNVANSFSPVKREHKLEAASAVLQVTVDCGASSPLPPSVHPDISHVHFSAAEIDARTREMGREIALAYTGVDDLLVLGVLKGCFVFLADVVRAIDPVPNGMTVDFIKASSYGGGVSSSGEVKVNMNVDRERIKGKHILLVEDIVDTAHTITKLRTCLLADGALDVKVVTLLDKIEGRQLDYVPDFVGFRCPNEFVVGFGLDFDEKYRSLPYIGVLRPHVYAHLNL